MASCMSYLGLTIGILALCCAACGLGLEYWVYSEDGDVYSGLWRRCRMVAGEKVCENELKDDYRPEYNAVRSMLIIGAVVLLISIIVGCLSLVSKTLSSMAHQGFASAIGHAIAGVFLMSGFVVYLETIYYPIGWSSSYNLSVGFILSVFSWLLSWIAAALILAGTYAVKRKHLLLM